MSAGLAATTVLVAQPAQAVVTGDVQFTGHGWGHGRGLGQWGSYGYAINAGWSYQQILTHYYGGTSQSQQANGPITVSLTGQDNQDLLVTSGRDFIAGGIRVTAGSAARIQARPDGSFQLQTSYGCGSPVVWTTTIPNSRVEPTTAPGNDLQAMLTLCAASSTKQYRGELSVVSTAAGQRTVNTVWMEDYLRGVVPRESPASWGDGGGGKGIEALKAQSVAARSYAWAENRSAIAKTCDTTACQVYLGAGTNHQALEDRRTDAAIAATSGVVLRNGSGGIVRAEFSSSTGGYSAGGAFPAVVDDGDAISPHHNWSQAVPATTIARAFGVGELMDLRVTGRNGKGADGGRVTTVEVVGTAKTVSVSGSAVRTQLGLKSDWFVVNGAPVAAPPAAGPIALPAVFQSGSPVTAVPFGDRGDVPLTCDWDGDGVDTVAVFRGGAWFVSTRPGGRADVVIGFGQGGDQPVCGDWDGDGRDSVGVFRDGVVFLRNSLTTGVADGLFAFGAPGDSLVAGDWNGDGFTTVGVWRGGAFYLTQSNLVPTTDAVTFYGVPTDLPVVGDWDGNRTDTIGVQRGNQFFLRNRNDSGVADVTVAFGDAGDTPVAGTWRAGARDTVGISRGY
ncbi:SpoIID/LytB domain-containing protein [Modestobacter sp. I12A-02628]|uniref:SpoIID/LytB domain-containing protein n=1 Tax=Goekera deserti TaxID=2497753 RepID=A0A7K3W822_9ACTN|nr:SpoIID/LytB domain-containing protein [Goekera deserti]MPR00337.1 SpoIID/LytB domain-containing protein [Goekera deserti]NDI49511.1 SpoIID/LytB domain-containing protein [Goekera deserti]NEL52615.1 SpoIID/LytB domain-containing protein [Goekera deserti]